MAADNSAMFNDTHTGGRKLSYIYWFLGDIQYSREYLASVPSLPCFDLPFAFTIICGLL